MDHVRVEPEAQDLRIVIKGHLGAASGRLFAGLECREVGPNTEVRGRVLDQAQLHGLIHGIEELALEILSLDVGSPHETATRKEQA